MLETAVKQQSRCLSTERTKECVTLRQVSWYRRGTFSVGNQTETMCQPERVWIWNKWKWSRNTENKKSLGRPPKGLASYVTQHKCDSFFIWTHKLRMPSLPANSLQRQQSANHRLRRRKKTLGCCQKYHLATRNTGHSWPTYSHLIMLAHYTQCNMALHPLAHAAVSNNAGLFQQYEYIYSWRPLMETPAFQSSLTASGKKVRAREIKGEREERTSSSPQLKWTVHRPLRAGLLSIMACEWDSSLSSLPHINSSDCESSPAAAACDRYSDI